MIYVKYTRRWIGANKYSISFRFKGKVRHIEVALPRDEKDSWKDS